MLVRKRSNVDKGAVITGMQSTHLDPVSTVSPCNFMK